MNARDPIDLHLLTGFLGAGKTTVLASALEQARNERWAVLVNELGEIAVDHWLLEHVGDDVLRLAAGCACCSIRDELYETLRRVAARGPTRIIVETTGLADPAPILHGLASDRLLRQLVRPRGVIAVVDAQRAEDLLASQPEVRRQLELADRIVLTKTDLAPAQRVAGIIELLSLAAPGCEIRAAEGGRVDPAWLFAAPALARIDEASGVGDWLHHHAHDDGDGHYETHELALAGSADVDVMLSWLRLVTQIDGDKLLRIKCLVENADGEVFALQSAGRSVSPPRKLGRRIEGVGVRLALIERGLGSSIDGLFASLRAAAEARRWGA